MPIQETPRLGELLVERGLLETSDLDRALQLQRVLGGRLGANLLDLALISEDDLLSTLGRQRRSATVDVGELRDIPAAVLNLVPEHLVRRYSAIPFAVRGNTVHLAVKDAIDMSRETEIAESTARLTRSFVGLELRIEEALDNYYRGAVDGTRRYAQIAERLERGVEPTHVRRTLPSELLAQQWEEDDASALADTAGIPISWEKSEPRTFGGAFIDDDAGAGIVIDAPDETEEIVLSTVDHYESRDLEPRSPVALIAAQKLLVDATNRHNVAQIALDSCSRAFKRRILFGLQNGRIVGWAADGRGIIPHRFDNLSVDLDRAPAFLAISRGADFWLGPLGNGTGQMPIAAAMGGDYPSTCLILPVRVSGRLVGFMYLDNLDEGVAGAPVTDLQSLVRMIGSSLENIITQRKVQAATRNRAAN